ncbi:MAG: recombinase family protein [Mogibacterium sp.]|nr:recombinase family protein [Mogibacterium sp.]
MLSNKRIKKDESIRGVIYARYSSHAQRDCSIEQQVEKAQAFAAERGINILRVYSDRAVSGRTDRRPEFQRMLQDAQAGLFDCVIAWKSNRLGRNMLQAMQTAEALADHGIRCMYVEEEFDDTASGRFALRTMMNVNQFYSENMAEDIRRGLIHSARQGRALGPIPFGYEKGPDGKYQVNEAEAPVVLEIFRRVAAGEPFADLAADLNRRGIRTKTGKPWGRSSFHRLLSNKKYLGIYQYAEIITPDAIPRIVPDALFEEVQHYLDIKKDLPGVTGRKGPGQVPYLLTGKIFCGCCGSPMIGVGGTSKSGRQYHYYACRKRAYEKACQKKNVSRDEIEYQVAKAIFDAALSPENLEKIIDYTIDWSKKNADRSGASACEERIRKANASIKAILDAVEKGFYNDSMQQRVLDLEAERRAAERELASINALAKVPTREELRASFDRLHGGDPEDKRFQELLFDTFLMAVYVYEDHLDVYFTGGEKRGRCEVPRPSAGDPSDPSGPECSYKRSFGPLGCSYTNTRLCFRDGLAVIRMPLKKEP